MYLICILYLKYVFEIHVFEILPIPDYRHDEMKIKSTNRTNHLRLASRKGMIQKMNHWTNRLGVTEQIR